MKNLKERVLSVLEEFPESRNDDILLLQKIWKIYYPEYLRDFCLFHIEALYDLPRLDHVVRLRASIQNDEKDPKFLPTRQDIAIKRRMNMDVWRARLGYDPAPKKKAFFISFGYAHKHTIQGIDFSHNSLCKVYAKDWYDAKRIADELFGRVYSNIYEEADVNFEFFPDGAKEISNY